MFALFCLFAGCTGIKPVRVEGQTMLPTLQDGDRIFLTKDKSDIKSGDIITFLYPKNENKWLIKRVIGLPNEKVEIKNG